MNVVDIFVEQFTLILGDNFATSGTTTVFYATLRHAGYLKPCKENHSRFYGLDHSPRRFFGQFTPLESSAPRIDLAVRICL